MKKESSNILRSMHQPDLVFTDLEGDTCKLGEQIYYCSDNNYNNAGIDERNQAELAVFSGNLIRLILGERQPEYKLTYRESKEGVTYYRVSQKIEHYQDWENCAGIQDGAYVFQWPQDDTPTPIEDAPIDGLTSILIACLFVGEADWDTTNFGLKKVSDRFVAIRLDPGMSFQAFLLPELPMSYEKTVDYFRQLYNNPLKLYLFNSLFNSSSENQYLPDIIHYPSGEIKQSSVADLFNDKKELISVVERIASLTESDIKEVARQSFTDIDENLVKQMILRLQWFDEGLTVLYECHEKETQQAQRNSIKRKKPREDYGLSYYSMLEPKQSKERKTGAKDEVEPDAEGEDSTSLSRDKPG